VVTLTPNEASGWDFSHWTGDASGSSMPVQVTMDGNKSVTAHFGQHDYTLTLTVIPPEGGTVNRSPAPDPNGKYTYGTVVTLMANAVPGYAFIDWSGDASGPNNPIQITMDGNKDIVAHFGQQRYTLTLAPYPSQGGSITADPNADPNDGKYAHGTSVTLTATAATWYTFSSWTRDASGATNPTTVIMDTNKSVNANFTTEQRFTLTLNVLHSNWGSVGIEPNDPNLPPFTYRPGTEVTLTAMPNEGKIAKPWTIYDPNYPGDPGHATENGSSVLVLIMNSNQYVDADFKCGSGMEQALPLLAVGLIALTLLGRRTRRRC
jgi:uncharacterized repeat protein (TIGR02543 family)